MASVSCPFQTGHNTTRSEMFSFCSRISHLIARQVIRGNHQCTRLPTPPKLEVLESPADASAARSWISQFRAIKIPRGVVELTFSRSSGPGGQNVNKVNTKATLRCPVGATWIPLWALPELRKSSFYVSSTQSVLISSSVHRSQAQNVDDCLEKLQILILSSSSAPVKSQPSKEQKKRVIDLINTEKAHRRVEKGKRSAFKRGRAKGKGGDWD